MLKKTPEGIYHGTPSEQDWPTRVLVSGRNLAHGKRSALERAFVAAGLHLNRIELTSPTIKQCARLTGVCVPYAAAAVAIADDDAARAAVLMGGMSLPEAARMAQSGITNAWTAANADVREQFVRQNLAELWHLIDVTTAAA